MISSDISSVERRIEPILAAELRYDFYQTPVDFFGTPADARTRTNCKDVGHQALRLLRGIYLPPEIQIVEAHQSPLFSRIDGQPQIGDWIMLGRPPRGPQPFQPEYDRNGALQNWSDFDINHLVVYLGDFRSDSLVLHATPEADGAVINTLKQATADRRTSVIHQVLRANPEAA